MKFKKSLKSKNTKDKKSYLIFTMQIFVKNTLIVKITI